MVIVADTWVMTMTSKVRTRALGLLAMLGLIAVGCGASTNAASSDDVESLPPEEYESPELGEVLESGAAAPGIDLELFAEDAIVGDPLLAGCTLADGSSERCFVITIANASVDADTDAIFEAVAQIPSAPVLTENPTIQFDDPDAILGITLDGALLLGAVEEAELPVGDTPFAYALDGFAVHGLVEDDSVLLDECNGHRSEEFGYHYHAVLSEGNAIVPCLLGVTVEGPGVEVSQR